MIVYRLSKQKYAGSLSGKGAALSNTNRWNSKGIEMVYTSGNIATAMTEILVHLSPNLIPTNYLALTISIPKTSKGLTIPVNKLPKGWSAVPPNIETQQIGDKFLEDGEKLWCKVPSAVVPGEWNVLLNPFHAEFKRIEITEKRQFSFDHRLFQPV